MAARASKIKIITNTIKMVTNQEYRKHCLENDKKDMDLAVAEKIIKEEWGQHLSVLNALFLRKDCFIYNERVFLSEDAYNAWKKAGYPNATPFQVKENLKKALFCKYLDLKQKEIEIEKRAEKQGRLFLIRFSKFYSDEAPDSARKRLEILDKVLLAEDRGDSKDGDSNTICISVYAFKLLQFLQRYGVEDFENNLRRILPSKYHEWRQAELQKREVSSEPSGSLAQSSQFLVETENKEEEESSSLSIPTVAGMSFFPSPPPIMPLKQIYEALNKISPFDLHFILSDKYAERFGSRLFNACNGMTEKQVEELAQRLKQECFVDAEKWRDGGYSVLIIYGVTDSKKFLQEDTQEKLRELLVNRKNPSQSSVSIPNGPG